MVNQHRGLDRFGGSDVGITSGLIAFRGGVRNDGKLAQRQSLRGSKSAACRFAGDRRVRLQVPAFTGVECLHEVCCLSGHEGSFLDRERDATLDSCRRM